MTSIVTLLEMVRAFNCSSRPSNLHAVRVGVGLRIANIELVHFWKSLLEGGAILAMSGMLVVEHSIVLSLALASTIVEWGSVWSESVVLQRASGITVVVGEIATSIFLFTKASVPVESLKGIALGGMKLTKAGKWVSVSFAGFFFLGFWVVI